METGPVMLFYALLSGLMGIVYLIYFGTGGRKNPYLLAFFMSKMLQGAGLVMLGLKDSEAAFSSPWLSAIMLTLGLSIETFVLISYDQVFRKRQFWQILLFCLAGILMVLLNRGASDAVIIIYFNSALSAVYLSSAWFLWKRKGFSRFARVCQMSFFGYGLAWVYAVTYALLHPVGLNMLNTANHSHIILSVASLLNFVIVSLGYIMLLKELDEQKLRENAQIMQRDYALLKQLNATKDRFFSIIAHDLRGPIGGLAQLGEMLSWEHNKLEEEEREKLLQLVAETSRNSFILLENLLLWARSESDGLQLKKEEIEAKPLLDNTIQLMDTLIRQKDGRVTCSIPENLTLFADPSMISTVCRNLLSNAVKFINPGGKIEISAESQPETMEFRLHFRDDGIGIPEDKVKDLLSLDSQYTRTGTRNESGSGLGLKLCNQFIQRHGGQLLIESAPGQGSCFTVSLPGYRGE